MTLRTTPSWNTLGGTFFMSNCAWNDFYNKLAGKLIFMSWKISNMRDFEATKSLAYSSKARASSAIVELEKSFMRLHSKVSTLVETESCFWSIVQVNNYEIVVNFFHISHNLTWYSAIVHKFTRIYPVCSTYELTKQFM